jgi:hypothetical protein
MDIRIRLGKLTMEAELVDAPTARKITRALPIKASFNTWGDEIYFSIPVTSDLDDNAREVVEPGTSAIGHRGRRFVFSSDNRP